MAKQLLSKKKTHNIIVEFSSVFVCSNCKGSYLFCSREGEFLPVRIKAGRKKGPRTKKVEVRAPPGNKSAPALIAKAIRLILPVVAKVKFVP